MNSQPEKPLNTEGDEFEREVALVRQNQELMDLLDQRSQPGKEYTIEQARKLLGIERSRGFLEMLDDDREGGPSHRLRIRAIALDVAVDRKAGERVAP